MIYICKKVNKPLKSTLFNLVLICKNSLYGINQLKLSSEAFKPNGFEYFDIEAFISQKLKNISYHKNSTSETLSVKVLDRI